VLDNEVRAILQEQFSMKRNYQRVINNVNKKHNRNIYAKIIKYTLIPTCAIIAICTIGRLNKNKEKENINIAKESHIDNKVEVNEIEGIWIPKVKFDIPDDTIEACREYGIIAYNDKMYTSSETISLEKNANLKGKFLGNVNSIMDLYRKSDYYLNATSTGMPYLEKFIEEQTTINPNTYIGDYIIDNSNKVYEVNGYDTDFRICTYNEKENSIMIFQRLNGIKVKYGKDIFDDRLKIKGNFEKIEYQYYSDWYHGKKDYKKFKNVTIEDINIFLDEINNAEFIDSSNLGLSSLNKKYALLYFTMKDGTITKLSLIEGGYVSYDGLYNIIKLETETFDKIFNEATPVNYVFEKGK